MSHSGHSLLATAAAACAAIMASVVFAAPVIPAEEQPPVRHLAVDSVSLSASRVATVDACAVSLHGLRAAHAVASGQVWPDALATPPRQAAVGSLAWAGIDETAALLGLPAPKRTTPATGTPPRDVAADESPNLESLAGIPAPEPPGLMLAGVALAAGGLAWKRRRRTA